MPQRGKLPHKMPRHPLDAAAMRLEEMADGENAHRGQIRRGGRAMAQWLSAKFTAIMLTEASGEA